MVLCPSATQDQLAQESAVSPGPLSRTAALCGEPNCPGLHQDSVLGPAMGQRHVASGIWSLGDLIRKQALERERGLAT